LRYRLQHLPWAEVARLAGYASAGAACTAVKREMGRFTLENVTELRQMQAAQYDEALAWLYPQIFGAGADLEHALWCLDRYYRGLEGKQRLQGLVPDRGEALLAMPYQKRIVIEDGGPPLLGPGPEIVDEG
jgi:hypothetical protein